MPQIPTVTDPAVAEPQIPATPADRFDPKLELRGKTFRDTDRTYGTHGTYGSKRLRELRTVNSEQ